MTAPAILLIGFSIFSAIVLTLTHFRREHYQGYLISRVMGLILLLALSELQFAHFQWLYFDKAWVETLPYRMTLFSVAPAFFLFSQPLLSPRLLPQFRPSLLLHALPALISPLLPGDTALPLAFIVGAGYLLWLARSLYSLRSERVRFHLEIILLGIVFAIAIGMSVIGLIQNSLPQKLFFSLYSIAIGLAFLLVQTTLGLRPQLTADVIESAQTAYANSTLANVDCDSMAAKLDALMLIDKIYIDPELSLAGLGARLGLSTHQLSELMNAHLGKGFSRYLREHRISAAKAMLCNEASASVLSVGLNVGFTSQSNFYQAFREIEGMTPGQFRKLNTSAGTPK